MPTLIAVDAREALTGLFRLLALHRASRRRTRQSHHGCVIQHRHRQNYGILYRRQLKLNSAIAAALVWGFANAEDRLPHQTHDEVEALINASDREQQMRTFGVREDWASGIRGRPD